MHTPEIEIRNHGYGMKKLFLLISLTALIAAASGRKPNQSNNQKPGPAPTPSTKTYSNAKYGFSFEYPTSMQFVTPNYANLEDTVVQVQIPRGAYGGTNFGDAAISVSAQHAKALDDCLALSPPEGSDGFKTKTTINGVNFYMTNSSGAGAGNFYDSKVYRTFKSTGGACIEISETIHTLNIDNYTPGTVTQVSQSDVQAKLDPIVQSFKLRTAVQVDPHSDFSLTTRARALLGSGDFNGAVQVLREGIDGQPDNPVLHNSLGTVLFEHGDVAGAISEFRRALALGSEDPELHVDLAIALKREGDQKEAIGQLPDAIKLDSNLLRAHFLLAEALIDGRQLQEAMTELDEVIRLRPDYAPAYSERGYVLVKQNNVDEAITQYREAIRLDPKFASAHANLGAAYWRKHDNEDGYKEVLIAHELSPNDPTIAMQFDKLPEKWKRQATQPAEIVRPASAPMGEPPKPDFMYYVDEQMNSLVPLEAETPTVGVKAGSFRTTVYSTVIGERSAVRLKAGSKWDFLIRPAGPTQKLNFRLERLESKGGSRTVSLGTKVKITNNPRKPGLLNFNSGSYGNSSIELTVPYDLVPGEYGFFVSANTGGFAMFCFGVDGP